MPAHYLLKSEPLPRIEDGVDVSFPFPRLLTSPDRSTTWDGVRNPRAAKTLRGMKVGDEAFWYHSNTKRPEIVGVVQVTVDGQDQADTTAFDQSSPYYDPKSSAEKPRWFMPTVQHLYPLTHSIPLSLLQHISSPSLTSTQRQDVAYLSSAQLEAISQMDLLRLARLSVQSVSDQAWEALCLMGQKQGWQEWEGKWNTGTTGGRKEQVKEETTADATTAKEPTGKTSTSSKRKSRALVDEVEEEGLQAPRAATKGKAAKCRPSLAHQVGYEVASLSRSERAACRNNEDAGSAQRRSSRLKR